MFRIKSQLDIHIRHNHTHERPYKCDICPKGMMFYMSKEINFHTEKNDPVQQQRKEVSIGKLKWKNYHIHCQ